MSDRSTVITPPGDNGWVYDAKRNEIDFISTSKASLYTYSLNSGGFTETLSIGGAPLVIAITPDNQDVVIGNQGTTSSGGKDNLSLTRVNLDTHAVDHLLTPSISASGAIYHLVIDGNGSAVFVYSPSMYDKGYMTFAATAPTPSIQDATAFNGFLVNGSAREFHQSTEMITSPDHRFLLVQEAGGAPSGLTLYDSASSAFVSILDPYHHVPGSQSGRGDITNSGMIVDVTPQSVVVFDRGLNVLKDLSHFQQDPLAGAVFSQDARELFVWDQAHKTLFVFDTQTWEKTASLTTSSGGIYNYFDVPGHSMQIVDHGALLAIDDGVHGLELIDLNAKFGLTAGPAPTSPPPMAPLGQATPTSQGASIHGNMDRAQLSDLLNSTITQADANRFAVTGPGMPTITLQGSGLTYANNHLTAGTITDVSFIDIQGGSTVLEFNLTGGSLPASQFETWLVSNNTAGAFQTLLAGADAIRGGTGNDLIRSYAGNDVIEGGGGGDTLFGGAGDDMIYATSRPNQPWGVVTTASTYLRGEEGDDFMVGGIGFDDMNGNMGRDTLSGGQGDDWVVGGQGGDQLFGDGGSDFVYGNLGDDTVTGGDGGDFVRGGQGADVLYGEAGNDWMSGDRGDDTITGGSGADTFYIFTGSGIDRVTDFNRAEGDRVQFDPGAKYTVSQEGADTVIDLGGGDRMVLAGVQSSSLGAGWVVGG